MMKTCLFKIFQVDPDFFALHSNGMLNSKLNFMF
jgi:hypothetical protein